MSDEELEIFKAFLTLLVALITLGLGWSLGQRLTVNWNLIQKRRETDIAILQQFYSLYGEFKEVSKIWRIIKEREEDSSLASLVVPPESRWSLLARASAVESKNEAITVKLAAERDLDADALKDLGLFRQGIQQLRESIRDNKKIRSSSRGPEYVFFNNLAVKVGSIISFSTIDKSSDPKIVSERASERLRTVANIRKPDFKTAIEDFKKEHPEYSRNET